MSAMGLRSPATADSAPHSVPDRNSLDQFRVFLFDIDGTLLSTGGAGVRAFRRASALWGHPGAMDAVSFHGRTDTSLAREFLQRVGLDDSQTSIHRFLDVYTFLLDDELSQGTGEVCPGVREWIALLSRRAVPPLLGLLTGNVRRGAVLKLSVHGLDGHFVSGAFGDDHESRDELAHLARMRAGRCLNQELAPHEIIVIGDTPADIACARAIGSPCLAVATGAFSVRQLSEHHPHWVVDSFRQIIDQPTTGR